MASHFRLELSCASLKLSWKLLPLSSCAGSCCLCEVVASLKFADELLKGSRADERTDGPRGLLGTHVGPGRGRRPGGFQQGKRRFLVPSLRYRPLHRQPVARARWSRRAPRSAGSPRATSPSGTPNAPQPADERTVHQVPSTL